MRAPRTHKSSRSALHFAEPLASTAREGQTERTTMTLATMLFVGAALVGDAQDVNPKPALFVRGNERFEPVPTRGDGTPVLLPLLSRSERVVRAVRTQRGIGLRSLAGVDLRVTYVEHADDERIVIDEVGRIVRLTGMHLPYSVRASADGDELLPWVARQDGVGLPFASESRSGLTIDERNRREGEKVIACAWPEQPNTFYEVSASPPTFAPFSGMRVTTDHIVLARVEALGAESDAAHVSEAKYDARYVEHGYAPPPDPAPGRTTTLIVRGSFGRWPVGARAAPAMNALFRDVSRSAGIDMVHMEGPDLQLDIRPTMGPGAAWGDIDGDGWVDLFLPQGGGREGSRVAKSKLYRNRGDGTFEDVSEKSGLALEGAGMGALFFDADGDLDLDLFYANYGKNRFMLNDGVGRFSDVTAAVGLDTDRWHAAVSAADYDLDGDLDLYVTSYLRYDEAAMPTSEELGRYQREDPVAMLPFAFAGEKKSLWRNDSRVVREASTKERPTIHFTDVAKECALQDEGGRGMQALFWDFDRDGDQDLYVANDVSPNRFWRNEGNGKWKDIAFSTGVDDPRGSMGLAVGDIEGDGDEDLFLTNWQLESNALYVNNLVNRVSAKSRVSTFRDSAVEAGLAQLSVGVTKWGCELVDFDLDLDLDLAYANGYTSPDYESTGICLSQPNHYFENDGEGRFSAAFERAGADFTEPLSSRCLLACDYDQDGDLDLVVTANNGRVKLLRNELEHGKKHWLGVRLRGKGGNTFAIGAEVEIEVGGKTLRRSLRAGTSYLGGNAPELHFGLGESNTIQACRVRWTSGKTTTHALASVDRFVTLEEP